MSLYEMNDPLRLAVNRARWASPPAITPQKIKITVENTELEALRAERDAWRSKYEWLVATTTTREDIPKPLKITTILELVGKELGFRPREICGPAREHRVTMARHIAMYLAKKVAGRGTPTIGRIIGDRDHTTAMNGIRKIERLRQTDGELDTLLKKFESKLNGPAFQPTEPVQA